MTEKKFNSPENPENIPTPERIRDFTGVEMKVELTNKCKYGRCKFCSPLFRPVVKEANAEQFLKLFEKDVETYFQQGGRKIILTGGGEPTDDPEKLFGTLRIINEKKGNMGVNLELLAIYSNGVNLLSPISENSSQTFLDKLAEMGVEDINLSISGSTQEEVADISGKAMGDVDFNELIPKIREKGIRVLTRTTLAKGYIDSVDDIKEFVENMSSLGVGIVYFSDLFEVPTRNQETTPGSKKVLQWTDEHRVDFMGLVEDVKNNDDFEFVFQSGRHKEQGQTFSFKHKQSGVKVLFGNLTIGEESDIEATYCYVKPDGSMEAHNNARRETGREYVDLENIKEYRPERDDI
ncbi:radical SAM protein [Patescibacteria group bacterium]|nr:radical SAM protein [Patescibacteria group bacterium]